jgi:hypothetical protein
VRDKDVHKFLVSDRPERAEMMADTTAGFSVGMNSTVASLSSTTVGRRHSPPPLSAPMYPRFYIDHARVCYGEHVASGPAQVAYTDFIPDLPNQYPQFSAIEDPAKLSLAGESMAKVAASQGAGRFSFDVYTWGSHKYVPKHKERDLKSTLQPVRPLHSHLGLPEARA